MADVVYTIGAGKQFNYDGNMLQTAPINFSLSFQANVPDPVAAGLVPYMESVNYAQDSFFQALVDNFKLVSMGYTISPSFRDSGTKIYSQWTERFIRNESIVVGDQEYFEIQESVQVPTWRLNFVNLVTYDGSAESRRLRQAYGYTMLSGSFQCRTRKKPSTDWKAWFAPDTDFTKIVVSASLTEEFRDNETFYQVRIEWKTNDLTYIPKFFLPR